MIFCQRDERRILPGMMRYGVIAAILLAHLPILRGGQEGSHETLMPVPPAQGAANFDGVRR